MFKGDTIKKGFKVKVNGAYLTPEDIEEVEVQITSQEDENSIKLLFTKGEVAWNEVEDCFTFFLSQEQTFQLDDLAIWQVRVKQNEEWTKGFPIQELYADKPLSKEVL